MLALRMLFISLSTSNHHPKYTFDDCKCPPSPYLHPPPIARMSASGRQRPIDMLRGFECNLDYRESFPFVTYFPACAGCSRLPSKKCQFPSMSYSKTRRPSSLTNLPVGNLSPSTCELVYSLDFSTYRYVIVS